MHHAAFHGHREIVDLLLSCGADINARDGLHSATPAGWAIEYIRECGGLLGIEIEDLIYAIGRRDITWARRLTTRHPALLQAVDREGTPLSVHAARTNDPQFVALFETADQRPEKA